MTLDEVQEIVAESNKLVDENKLLKEKIETIGDFIHGGDLCSICKFENKCNPQECHQPDVLVKYTKWELRK